MDIELVILRGLPGAGKSTMASLFEQLGYTSVCNDDYFVGVDGVYRFNPEERVAAEDYCFKRAKLALQDGKKVVVHNVFVSYRAVKRYTELAQSLGKRYAVMVVEGNHGNVHAVPDDIRNNMKLGFQFSPV